MTGFQIINARKAVPIAVTILYQKPDNHFNEYLINMESIAEIKANCTVYLRGA